MKKKTIEEVIEKKVEYILEEFNTYLTLLSDIDKPLGVRRPKLHGMVESWPTMLNSALTSVAEQATKQVAEDIREDMLNRMKNWHGAGTAMVKDYFDCL